jgi:hypothetical protein
MNSLSSYSFTDQSSIEPLVWYVHCSPWYDVFTEEARHETWNILRQIFDRISVIIKTQTYVFHPRHSPARLTSIGFFSFQRAFKH